MRLSLWLVFLLVIVALSLENVPTGEMKSSMWEVDLKAEAVLCCETVCQALYHVKSFLYRLLVRMCFSLGESVR